MTLLLVLVLLTLLVTSSSSLFTSNSILSSLAYAQFNNCDSSYPDVCIPPPPPDLDCADVSSKNFRVLSPDPHGFDREGDGIGCES